METNQTSTMLNLTRAVFFINALVWLVFGLLSLFLALEVGTATRWIYSLLMIANAAVMFWFGLIIISGRNKIFFLAILYIALNVVLSITDQFGMIDALILLLNLCLLGLLFVTRQRIAQAEG
jgi:hypothetical protein